MHNKAKKRNQKNKKEILTDKKVIKNLVRFKSVVAIHFTVVSLG